MFLFHKIENTSACFFNLRHGKLRLGCVFNTQWDQNTSNLGALIFLHLPYDEIFPLFLCRYFMCIL